MCLVLPGDIKGVYLEGSFRVVKGRADEVAPQWDFLGVADFVCCRTTDDEPAGFIYCDEDAFDVLKDFKTCGKTSDRGNGYFVIYIENMNDFDAELRAS
jgi:hypothetical protein